VLTYVLFFIFSLQFVGIYIIYCVALYRTTTTTMMRTGELLLLLSDEQIVLVRVRSQKDASRAATETIVPQEDERERGKKIHQIETRTTCCWLSLFGKRVRRLGLSGDGRTDGRACIYRSGSQSVAHLCV